MLDKFTYKQKNYGLLVLFILLAMVSYKRSFVLSLNVSREISRQDIQKQNIGQSSNRLKMLHAEIERLNRTLGKTDQTSEKVRQQLLKEISKMQLKQNVRIESFSNPHVYNSVDYKILSHEVLLEGSYRGLVKSINYLENNFVYARIVNTKIFKTKTYGEAKSKVYAKILFQHYYKM